VDGIRIAVTSVAGSYSIDARVLLGIVMEESHGGVGVVTTTNADGVPTGGLMQTSGCHGYDGQNNLAQVSNDNIFPLPRLLFPSSLFRQSRTGNKFRTHFADKHVTDHRPTSPT